SGAYGSLAAGKGLAVADVSRLVAFSRWNKDDGYLFFEMRSGHFSGRKRIALQTLSMAIWRTPCIFFFSRCFQRMSLLRSVSNCPAFGYIIHAMRSSLAASKTGPHIASTSASVLTK